MRTKCLLLHPSETPKRNIKNRKSTNVSNFINYYVQIHPKLGLHYDGAYIKRHNKLAITPINSTPPEKLRHPHQAKGKCGRVCFS